MNCFLPAPRILLLRTRLPSFLSKVSTTPRSSSHSRLSSMETSRQLVIMLNSVLVQNMGHMFMQVGSKPIDPSLSQIAQEVVSFFNRERNR